MLFPEIVESYIGQDTETGMITIYGHDNYLDGRRFELCQNSWTTEIRLIGNGYDEPIASYQSYATARMAYKLAAKENTFGEALNTLEQVEIETRIEAGEWCVYVLHFDRKVGKPWTPIERKLLAGMEPRTQPYSAHAHHYVGVTNDLAKRMKEHGNGHQKSSPLVKELLRLGGTFQVAQLYCFGSNESEAHLEERRIKRRKETPRLCSICKESK